MYWSFGSAPFFPPFAPRTDRKRVASDRDDHVRRLERALAEVRELQSILPICMYCTKVRDDENYWSQIDQYLAKNTGTRFSHGICPDCLRTHHPDQCEREDPPPNAPGTA